jgi:hypothetical protein
VDRPSPLGRPGRVSVTMVTQKWGAVRQAGRFPLRAVAS